jgi:hypothetical protein
VGGALELLRSGDGVRRAASWACGESRGRRKQVRRRLGETRRTRLELDDPFGRVNVDDSVAALPHTPHRTRSRVGSRGPKLSKVNTPLRIVWNRSILLSFCVNFAKNAQMEQSWPPVFRRSVGILENSGVTQTQPQFCCTLYAVHSHTHDSTRTHTTARRGIPIVIVDLF